MMVNGHSLPQGVTMYTTNLGTSTTE